MEQFSIILEDSNPLKNWRVIGCFDNTIWLEASVSANEKKFQLVNNSDSNNSNYDTSTIYEVDLDSGEKKEIKLPYNPFVLVDFKPTKNYLYTSIIFDANNDGKITKDDQEQGKVLLQFDRSSQEIKTLYSFDKDDCYESVNIEQVLEDLAILLHVSVFDNDDIVERYDLLRLDNNQIRTIYINNEEMIDCQVFLTKGKEGLMVVLDKHVMPSDKIISGGLPDKILVFK